MGRLATRTAGPARSAQQILADLEALARNWHGDPDRPDGIFDGLLGDLLDVWPDLCCQPGACVTHKAAHGA